MRSEEDSLPPPGKQDSDLCACQFPVEPLLVDMTAQRSVPGIVAELESHPHT
jgi:hypothetical protein